MRLRTAISTPLATTAVILTATLTGTVTATAAETGGPTDTATAAQSGSAAPVDTSAKTSASAQFSNTSDFLNYYEGSTLANSRGSYPGQCVSLISRLLEEVYGVDHGAWGNAIDYQAGGSGGQQMAANGFSWNTDTNFQNGDIVVWGNGANTTAYGHIGIYWDGQIWHQNWNDNMSLHAIDFNNDIDAYLGYWRG